MSHQQTVPPGGVRAFGAGGARLSGSTSRLWLKFWVEFGQFQVPSRGWVGCGMRGAGAGGNGEGFFGGKGGEGQVLPWEVTCAADTPFAEVPGGEIRGGQK